MQKLCRVSAGLFVVGIALILAFCCGLAPASTAPESLLDIPTPFARVYLPVVFKGYSPPPPTATPTPTATPQPSPTPTPCIQYVSGIISSNTTWQSGCTYIVTGNLGVEEHVTLTIEPGVVVKFDKDCRLQVIGNLIAQGTPEDMIVFTSNLPDPSPGAWLGIEFPRAVEPAKEKSNISYCKIEYAGTGLYYCGRLFDLSHNIFANNYDGVHMFVGGHDELGPVRLEYNLFTENRYSVYIFGHRSVHMSYNTIANNGAGIRDSHENLIVHYNNIHSNSQYDFRHGRSTDIDATHNWWGTTDSSLIDQHIYDYYDDLTLGKVIYEPFATGPIPGAP
ncbi:MAG: hypothetical protein DRI52_09885 [Chloroflexi bacterium]|nr:MAG: hypothetical protein DRI52_09885 [Chloroflexota bacterium]